MLYTILYKHKGRATINTHMKKHKNKLKKNYKHILVDPQTHELLVEVSKGEGRHMMYLVDMLIKNYVITQNDLRKESK